LDQLRKRVLLRLSDDEIPSPGHENCLSHPKTRLIPRQEESPRAHARARHAGGVRRAPARDPPIFKSVAIRRKLGRPVQAVLAGCGQKTIRTRALF